MGIKVEIEQFLAKYTNNQRIIGVEGDTIGECLKNLEKQFPKLKLFDEDGELLEYLTVFANNEIVRPQELDKPVNGEGDLSIIMMVMDFGG